MVRVITTTLGKQDDNRFIELRSKPLSETPNLCDIKVPYVIKDKLFICPGTWNNQYYSPAELHKAYGATDWTVKENNHLFLDHDDQKVSSWVGAVENVHMVDEELRGDLVIIDLPTARKLAYGAKFGISGKLGGTSRDGAMFDFDYNNWSVVVTPAVNKAYINNSQESDIESLEVITAMEAKRKELDMPVSEFYAIPRDPPSSSKLPIFDADHVRNAIARFGQVTDVTTKEKETAIKKIKTAAKKFGIKTTINNSQDNSKVDTMSEITEKELGEIVTNSEWTDFVKAMRAKYPDMDFKEIAAKFKEKGTVSKDDVKAEPVKAEPTMSDAKLDALTDILSKLSEKIETVDGKLNDTSKQLGDMQTAQIAKDEIAKKLADEEESENVETPVEDAEPVKDAPVETKAPAAEEKTVEAKVVAEPVDSTPVVESETPATDVVVENKSKDVKTMSEEIVDKATLTVSPATDAVKTYTTEECDRTLHKAMLRNQGNGDIADQI